MWAPESHPAPHRADSVERCWDAIWLVVQFLGAGVPGFLAYRCSMPDAPCVLVAHVPPGKSPSLQSRPPPHASDIQGEPFAERRHMHSRHVSESRMCAWRWICDLGSGALSARVHPKGLICSGLPCCSPSLWQVIQWTCRAVRRKRRGLSVVTFGILSIDRALSGQWYVRRTEGEHTCYLVGSACPLDYGRPSHLLNQWRRPEQVPAGLLPACPPNFGLVGNVLQPSY